MAKDPTFPFYAQDFLVDTLRWSRGMKSLHVDLLAESWVNGGLDDEDGHPFGLHGEDLALWERIKNKWEFREGRWINARLEEVRSKRERFRETQGENGKKGGRPKKGGAADIEGLGFEFNNPAETQAFLKTKPEENLKKSLLEKENEKENEIENSKEGGSGEENARHLVPAMLTTWLVVMPDYPEEREKDFPALQALAKFFANRQKVPYNPRDGDCMRIILNEWQRMAEFVSKHEFFKNHSLQQISRHSQSIIQSQKNEQNGAAVRENNPLGGRVEAPGRKAYGGL